LEFSDYDDGREPLDNERSVQSLGGSDQQRQFVVRRLIAIGAGVLIVILLVLAVRGILDARKTRAFENYVVNVASLADASSALSQKFFSQLTGTAQEGELSFESQVSADKATAQELLNRAAALDAPSEMASANADILLAFGLRRDGLSEITEQIPAAGADEGSDRAFKRITAQMRVFLASDVLYARGRTNGNTVLAEQRIVGQEIPQSKFLPDEPNWLDPAIVEANFPITGGSGGAVAPGVHGVGLFATTINGVALIPGGPTTVSLGDGNPEIEVTVQNQGESDEADVGVSFTLGATSGKDTIPTIAPQETATVTIPINPAPAAGQPLTLDVTVDPVDGELVEDNNSFQYTVTFQ